MKKILMVMLMLMGAGEGNAQPDSLWSRRYGQSDEDQCYSIIQTRDGGFALAGWTYSFQNARDFFVVKTNADGDSLWSRTFGGEGWEEKCKIIQTSDGGFAVAGGTTSFDAGEIDFWLVRIDSTGDSLWSRSYGGENAEECNALLQTSDGGFALAGWTNSFGAGASDFWLVKTNSYGDSIWSRTYGGDSLEECNSIVETNDGGFALAGWTESFGTGNSDFWLLKTDSDGDSLWSCTFGGRGYDFCHSLVQTGDGGFALGGISENHQLEERNCLLVRTNADGDSLWSRHFDDWHNDWLASIILMKDGGFALAAATNTQTNGGYDIWLARTDRGGDILWRRTFGGHGSEFCTSLIQTADKGFALAGMVQPRDEEYDFWLVKTGADPVSVSDSRFQLSTFNFQLCPNPFNASTTFTYSLPRKAPMELGIYDLSGRLVERIAQGVAEAGEHSVVWTAPGSGVYFAVLQAEGEGKAVRKVVGVR